ncbi:MAG: type VI secretion system baseplate subunit TssG [Polyangia bacterium]
MSGADSVAGYQLFSLLRLIESQAPHAAALGESGPASAEAVRLRPSPGTVFPDQRSRRGRTPAKCRRSALFRRHREHLGTVWMGLLLPRSYPHQVLLQADTDPRQRDFLDIIHHRVLSLWYRSFRRQHYEQSFAEDGTDSFTSAAGLDRCPARGNGRSARNIAAPLAALSGTVCGKHPHRSRSGSALREELHQPIVGGASLPRCAGFVCPSHSGRRCHEIRNSGPRSDVIW